MMDKTLVFIDVTCCKPAKFMCNYCGKEFYREIGHQCGYDIPTLVENVVELEKKLAGLTDNKAVL